MPSGSPPVGPSSVDRVPSERGLLKGAEGSEGAAWPPGRPLLETEGIAEAAVKPDEGGELIRSGMSKQGNASAANLEGLTDALNLEQRRLFSASKNRVQHEEVVEGRCSQKT